MAAPEGSQTSRPAASARLRRLPALATDRLAQFWQQVFSPESMTERGRQAARIWQSLLLIFGLLAYILLAALLIAPSVLSSGGTSAQRAYRIGDVVAEDVRAPVSTTYASEVLTQERREAAAAAVNPVYAPPDLSVARQQITRLGQILDQIETIRQEETGTTAQNIEAITLLRDVNIDAVSARSLLALNDETWQAVRSEATLVLERVMRESIREIDLSQVIEFLPTQVSLRLDDAAARTVLALVRDLVRPNRTLNPEATEAARTSAANAVPVETRSFERGQIVVRAGTRMNAADYEALLQLGLLETPDQRARTFVRALLAATLVVVFTGFYLLRRQPQWSGQPGIIALCALLSLTALFGARLLINQEMPYLYPMAALALIIVVLTNAEIAIVGIFGQSILSGLMFGSSLEIAVYYTVGGIIGALVIRATDRINIYFVAGVVIALINLLVILIFHTEIGIPQPATAEGEDIVRLLLSGALNGLITSMAALAVTFALTAAFNLTTSLKLAELSQPNQPLLQRLLREAPGTYQHSLQVANLCEQAANAIGANAELVRVAALYHDVGKMLNPAFFIENQAEGVNPHDALNDPYRSADIIISHVADGDRLARQYRLPTRVRDFILEHHGTTLVGYFYNQALAQASEPGTIDEGLFRYGGPRPRTRETAILMLADASESTVRARKPGTKAEVAEIISRIIESRIQDGQLNAAALTLNDLEQIRETLVDLLQSVFHPRINYPVWPRRMPASPSMVGEGTTSDPYSTPVQRDGIPSRTGEVSRTEFGARDGRTDRHGEPSANGLRDAAEFTQAGRGNGASGAGLLPELSTRDSSTTAPAGGNARLPATPMNPTPPVRAADESGLDADDVNSDEPVMSVPPLRRTAAVPTAQPTQPTQPAQSVQVANRDEVSQISSEAPPQSSLPASPFRVQPPEVLEWTSDGNLPASDGDAVPPPAGESEIIPE